MIKDLQLFGKWLNENNQVDFGKNVKDDDYIFTIFYNDGNFLLGGIDLKENSTLNYYQTSCFNEDLFHSSNQNVIIPSLSNLFGFSPFFTKAKDNFLTRNDKNQKNIDSFKKVIKKSIDANKNNKDFVSIANEYFTDLENKFINVCDLNDVQKSNMLLLSQNCSSEDISNLIISYYEFLLENFDEIVESIINFKKSDKYINKNGSFYLACIFEDYHDLINDFFYLYSNFLQIRKKTYKDYKEGTCSICGEKNITYPTMTYFNLDNVSFNNKPQMKNSKLRLCKNCSTFVKYADDKLLKLINNNHFLIIPKIKKGSYENFLRISNREINSFEKINQFLKDCDNFNFDLLIITIDKRKNNLITIKRYVENYKAFLVQFEDLFLYNFNSMNYLFNEKLTKLNENSINKIENTFDMEKIFKEFFYDLNQDNNFKFPNLYHFYEIYTKNLTGSQGIFNNFNINTVSIFSRYSENIFSFIYELNLDAINKKILNEIVLNSIQIFQKNSFGETKVNYHILKRLNYYYMFKKEFLEDFMLSNENMNMLKENFGKHDEQSNVIFNIEEKNSILSLIEEDPAIKYYLLGQFISYIDILKSFNKKRGNVFSNYVNNVNRNNVKKLFVTEVLQKNNFYIEKMSKKSKFVFTLLENNIDILFNEIGFDYEDYLLLIFTGYYTENILLSRYSKEE